MKPRSHFPWVPVNAKFERQKAQFVDHREPSQIEAGLRLCSPRPRSIIDHIVLIAPAETGPEGQGIIPP